MVRQDTTIEPTDTGVVLELKHWCQQRDRRIAQLQDEVEFWKARHKSLETLVQYGQPKQLTSADIDAALKAAARATASYVREQVAEITKGHSAPAGRTMVEIVSRLSALEKQHADIARHVGRVASLAGVAERASRATSPKASKGREVLPVVKAITSPKAKSKRRAYSVKAAA